MPARALRRTLVAGAAGAAALLALPTAAGAHVEAEGETVAGVTTVTFSFHHGCDGNPTTSLRVQLPAGATDVEAQDPAGWTSTITATELAWTGGEVPNEQEASFVATMKLTDPEGTTVFLPTVQGCTNGTEAAWIDKSDDPEAEQAAPRITAGAVVADEHGHDEEEAEGSDHGSTATTAVEATTNADAGTTTTAAATETQDASATTTASESSSKAPLIIGIIAAVVVIAGLIAFFLSRRGSGSSAS